MATQRCGYCTKPLTRRDTYLLPENMRGAIPTNADPFVCKSDFKRIVGMYPSASDLVSVIGAQR